MLISRKAAATQQITSGTLLPSTRSNAAGKQERGHARCPISEKSLIDQVGMRTQHCLKSSYYRVSARVAADASMLDATRTQLQSSGACR